MHEALQSQKRIRLKQQQLALAFQAGGWGPLCCPFAVMLGLMLDDINEIWLQQLQQTISPLPRLGGNDENQARTAGCTLMAYSNQVSPQTTAHSDIRPHSVSFDSEREREIPTYLHTYLQNITDHNNLT